MKQQMRLEGLFCDCEEIDLCFTPKTRGSIKILDMSVPWRIELAWSCGSCGKLCPIRGRKCKCSLPILACMRCKKGHYTLLEHIKFSIWCKHCNGIISDNRRERTLASLRMERTRRSEFINDGQPYDCPACKMRHRPGSKAFVEHWIFFTDQ